MGGQRPRGKEVGTKERGVRKERGGKELGGLTRQQRVTCGQALLGHSA